MVGSVFNHLPSGGEGKSIGVSIIIRNEELGIRLNLLKSLDKTNLIDSYGLNQLSQVNKGNELNQDIKAWD